MSARIAKPIVFAFCMAIMMLPATLFAQFGGNNNGNNNNNGFNNNNNVGGVKIDANGVLSSATDSLDPDVRRAMQAALTKTSSDLGDATNMRMVSFKGLEAAIVKANQSGEALPIDVLFLAGLQRIEYVIASPETGDIIIAGPAEGLKVTADGDVVGEQSGRPALRLEDLIVAINSVDNARTGNGVSVSINPTEQGIKNLRKVSRSVRQFHPSMQATFAQAMGDQDITLTGVPTDSRFSHILVAADYKMKRLSMGFDAAPIKNFPSLLEMGQKANATRMNASPRFWMECDYQPLAKSDDNLVWQIRGSGVKTLTEEDRYDADGKAKGTGKQNRLAKKWADMMTERYGELAAADPVFQDLKNLMDLSVAAAIIRKYDMASQVGLEMPTLKGETKNVSLVAGPAPKTVPTQCSFVKVSNSWLVSTSGGVQLDSWGAIENPEVDGELAKLAAVQAPANDRWYWNAK
ncbi:MAG: DUF1598 domain-containing protein [Planctomycetota bacterium]